MTSSCGTVKVTNLAKVLIPAKRPHRAVTDGEGLTVAPWSVTDRRSGRAGRGRTRSWLSERQEMVTHMTEIGYFLSSEDHNPKDLVEHARLAEANGFSSLCVPTRT